MKVLVVGAAGKTGQLVVERALAAGHAVTAFVHDANAYWPPAGVRAFGGDAADLAKIDEAMAGQDAVIDAIGGKIPFLNTGVETNSAEAILEAMKRRGVQRLVVVSSLGVGESKEQLGFFAKHLIMPTLLRGAMKDKEAMEQTVTQSGVEFVLVRPPRLTDDPATGQVRVVPDDETPGKITRADLATFLVDQLTSNAHLGKAVAVANAE